MWSEYRVTIYYIRKADDHDHDQVYFTELLLVQYLVRFLLMLFVL